MNGIKKDLTGMRRGKLVAVRPAGYRKNGQAMWICKCDCGNEHLVRAINFKVGQILSCGCSRQKKVHKYGDEPTKGMRLYTIHAAMKQRCYNPRDANYHYYGGRGIRVCDEWLDSFETFRDWALQTGYADDLTIDRIDVNGNYCPENCRWATKREQSNNTRANFIITYCGKTMTLTEWSRKLGVEYSMLRNRIKYYGWSVERAFTEPPHFISPRRKTKNEQNTLAQNTI